MKERPLRVVKVGGSLLTFNRLEQSLRTWLSGQTPAVNVLVVGGGGSADAVRDASQPFGLTDEQSHWLAVEAMTQSARVVHALLPEAVVASTLTDIRAAEGEALLIIDPLALLRSEPSELGPERLPHTWAVTSDSIAARIAEAVQADELVLLKSCPSPSGKSWREAAETGYVDAYFPEAAARLRCVRAVNLRDERESGADIAAKPTALSSR